MKHDEFYDPTCWNLCDCIIRIEIGRTAGSPKIIDVNLTETRFFSSGNKPDIVSIQEFDDSPWLALRIEKAETTLEYIILVNSSTDEWALLPILKGYCERIGNNALSFCCNTSTSIMHPFIFNAQQSIIVDLIADDSDIPDNASLIESPVVNHDTISFYCHVDRRYFFLSNCRISGSSIESSSIGIESPARLMKGVKIVSLCYIDHRRGNAPNWIVSSSGILLVLSPEHAKYSFIPGEITSLSDYKGPGRYAASFTLQSGTDEYIGVLRFSKIGIFLRFSFPDAVNFPGVTKETLILPGGAGRVFASRFFSNTRKRVGHVINVYGCYGRSLPAKLSEGDRRMIDKGWEVIFLHARGGSEFGYGWYRQGTEREYWRGGSDLSDICDYLEKKSDHPVIVRAASAGSLPAFSAWLNGSRISGFIFRNPVLDLREMGRISESFSEHYSDISEVFSLAYRRPDKQLTAPMLIDIGAEDRIIPPHISLSWIRRNMRFFSIDYFLWRHGDHHNLSGDHLAFGHREEEFLEKILR